ncbi:MAG: transcription termination factor Rho [Deltaproteobacteria bacterium]|nr:transcription termination factor Rho [Deltaproteobacteria bacterium]
MTRLDIRELKAQPLEQLAAFARAKGVDNAGSLSRQQLIFDLLRAGVDDNDAVSGDGVLEVLPDGFGFLRDPAANYLSGPDDIYVSPSQIRRFNLRTGDWIRGRVRPPKEGERYFALTKVETLNGADPEQLRDRPLFDNLTPLHPERRFILEHGAAAIAPRLIDLFAPVGKGQRGLIVAPPRAGKTVLLQQIAQALAVNHPEVKLIVLLIDERPEEVTEMQRSVRGEVIASTFDEPPARHVQVAEMVIERARRLVEDKHDVVILLDSLTRLARAYNHVVPSSGKLLSGGVDAAALHRPKRFFGAARSVEQGGSLTILATALVETGSRMDEVIFEEFKGTGNMELVLDRRVAERRIFPAVDLLRSGTRRDEKLLEPAVLARVDLMRQAMQGHPIADMEWVLTALGRHETNDALLRQVTTG